MRGPKGDRGGGAGVDRDDLAGSYEALRATALAGGPGSAGLGAGLLMARGVAGWMRGWRACVPAAPVSGRRAPARSSNEVVNVLAAMTLACADGR